MKVYKVIVVTISLMISYNVKAQKIWEGDLLTKDLIEFNTGKYTEVNGSITVKNYTKKDLSLLKKLEKCTGSIYILDNKALENLNGLENLKIVGGKFSIIKNPELYGYCALQKTLLNQGINGVKLNKRVIEKFETEDNGYDPSLTSLQNKKCTGFKFEEFCFSC